MEEIKCYISEQNIKKRFKFFMFLQLEKYSEDHAKGETGFLLEGNSNTLHSPRKDSGAFLLASELTAHTPTAPCPSRKAMELHKKIPESHANLTRWLLTN